MRPRRRNGPAGVGAVRLEHDVRRDAEARRDAGVEPVLGHVRDAGRDRHARVAGAQRHRRRRGRVPAVERPHPRRPPRRARAARCPRRRQSPSTSPARTASETSCEAPPRRGRPPPRARRARASTSPIACSPPGRRVDVDVAADHQRGERLRASTPAVSTVADRAAAAQHGDAVGDGHHLVQLVRDEDHRAPVGGHRAQRLEQRRPPPAA